MTFMNTFTAQLVFRILCYKLGCKSENNVKQNLAFYYYRLAASDTYDKFIVNIRLDIILVMKARND